MFQIVRRNNIVFKLSLFALILVTSLVSQARPEYANRHGLNRCTACHFNPAGGGLRNKSGKLYGAKGFGISKYASQDYVSAEMRMLYYNPKQRDQASSGLFLMAGIVGGSIAVTPKKESTEVRAVLSHNILGGTSWDSYVRVKMFDDTKTSWLPQYYVLGRFHAPFGLLTDEHRTYTKIQTLSDYNKKMEGGLMISGQPFEGLHYDFSYVNGEAGGAGLPPSGNAEIWGGIANVRFLSPSRWLPLTIGASYKTYERQAGKGKYPWARSLYGVLSLERLIGGYFNADLSFEIAYSKHLISETSGTLLADAAYIANLEAADAESKGMYGMLSVYLSQKLSLELKYDRLDFNKEFSGDALTKTGLGFKYYLAANTFTTLRVEQSAVGQPDEKSAPKHRSDDAVWLYMQMGI